MSPKELSYLEDVLGHEKHLQTKCQDYAKTISDPELKSFVEQLGTKHQTHFDQFYRLLKA